MVTKAGCFIFIILISNLAYSQSRPRSAARGSSKSENGPTSSYSSLGKQGSAMSDDMYAPKTGGSNLIFNFILPIGNIDSTSSGGSKATYSGYFTTLEYGYGYSEKVSYYINVSQANYTTTYNTTPETYSKINGMHDGAIGVKGINNNAGSFFYYDVNYNSSITNPIKSDAATGVRTGGSIRPTINIKLGGGFPLASLTLGAKLTYSLYQEGKAVTTLTPFPSLTTTYKSGSGSAWKAFLQSNTSWKFGISYEDVTVDTYNIEVLGVTVSNPSATGQLYSLYTLTSLGASTEMMLKLEKPSQKGSSSSYNAYNMILQFRFLF